MDNRYNVIHMDRRQRNVCIICTEGLEESKEEVALKANTYGMEALTEYEQCFLEGFGKGMCPDCIEAHQDMDAIISVTDRLNENFRIDQGLDEVDHGPMAIADGGEMYPEEMEVDSEETMS